ncbi:hypothetical protein [Micromonospora sp. WMMD1082]|uniref:hypothetical protein n=1 Tax=Micromonospora sp. WMMD1082 TaxID=3016104 RepID=UPI002415B58D|nr:hypothetical protein [Micromonospora sp. WMMD1082]MDG4797987.1 hypothetical protein [Micromonospora sp. WMMD1082]
MTSRHGHDPPFDGIVSDMLFGLHLLMRWLLRRPAPTPPGTGRRYQEVEQAAAQQRLLDHAAYLRSHGHHERAQDMWADQRSGPESGHLR